MPAVIDKALDFIGAMDVSAPTPSSMNESTAKGIGHQHYYPHADCH